MYMYNSACHGILVRLPGHVHCTRVLHEYCCMQCTYTIVHNLSYASTVTVMERTNWKIS